MDCINCNDKKCMKTESCKDSKLSTELLINSYSEDKNQQIIQASAQLVDGGRAGTLSRIQELLEFSKKMGYKKIGLAYCYGMHKEALMVSRIFEKNKLILSTVSCSVGGLPQSDLNHKSQLCGVSCNPIGQAEAFNKEQVDFVMIMGICLGHDILLQKHLNVDFSTLVVKDRVYSHNPLKGIRALSEELG